MKWEWDTEPRPLDREERFGAFFAIIGSILFFGGGTALLLFLNQ